MNRVDFIGQTRQDSDNAPSATARLINCYREPLGGRTNATLKAVPGLVSFSTLSGVWTRAIARINELLYVVHGGFLYEITSTGATKQLGAIADDENTTISGNAGSVTVVAGGNYYVWDGTTLSQPSTGAISSVGSVTFIGFLTVLTEKDGKKLQWSTISAGVPDPKTMNALDFASAEQRDDDLVRGMVSGGVLYAFKDRSIEMWQRATAGIQVIQSRTLDHGLEGFNLACEFPDGLFYVGSDGKARILSAGASQPVSTVSVETAIENGTPTHCLHYQVEGHDMLCIRFSDRPAWCLDLSTGEWHERATGPDFDPWAAIGAVKAYDSQFAITQLGDVVTMQSSNEDLGETLVQRAVSRTFQLNRQFFRVPELEILGRTGEEPSPIFGDYFLGDGNGAALLGSLTEVLTIGDVERTVPKIELRVSRDFGRTWSAPKVRTFGNLGDYEHVIKWRALGRFKQMTAEITWSDDPTIPIDSEAYVRVA